uniref:Serine protease inhibitor, potato inhibitor I-type family protein n=1 Tax=Solanum tuberosum TaxID=4113 RepID=M1CK84_SOLTU
MEKTIILFSFGFLFLSQPMVDAKYPPCENCLCTGNTCKSPGETTPYEWPELIGVEIMKAKTIVERSNPNVTGVPLDSGCMTLVDPVCCNRVWLCPDKKGLIKVKPVVG